MRPIFKYGSETASSSRIESNFNNLKHRVFKNDILPLRVDTFVEKLIEYYRGDHLLLQGSMPNNEIRTCDGITNDDIMNDIEIEEDVNQEKEADNESHLLHEKDYEEEVEHKDNIEHTLNYESDNYLVIQSPSKSCLACANGDFPSGLHKCQMCRKNVHLFGCSFPAPNTDEGCGEERLCFICAETFAENNARERWGKKSTTEK